MPLPSNDYYDANLASLHQRLLDHAITRAFLTGTGIRFDGDHLTPADRFAFPMGELSTLEFAHLFSVFDGSRVHKQAQRHAAHDDAPPGLYFTVVNTRIIQNQHKNRSGLFEEESGATDLFIEGLHIDHFFLNKHRSPASLGTIAFALCAITAHLANLSHISLVAAGGIGFNPKHVGYKVWPKLGFDAPMLVQETDPWPHLRACQTVQEVLAVDPAWWDENGSQRRMGFDLTGHSASWAKLLTYVGEKVLAGDRHD